MGGGDTYQMYVRELEGTTRLADEGVYSEATGRGLRGIIAEQAQLAGWAAYDAGNYEGARGHYMTALAASRAAEDTALEGNSLAFLAYLEWSVGGGSGIRFATAAYEALGAGTVPCGHCWRTVWDGNTRPRGTAGRPTTPWALPKRPSTNTATCQARIGRTGWTATRSRS
ncbi:hypothetical protein SMICM304S_09238 [Streptomyces microflavus]